MDLKAESKLGNLNSKEAVRLAGAVWIFAVEFPENDCDDFVASRFLEFDGRF